MAKQEHHPDCTFCMPEGIFCEKVAFPEFGVPEEVSGRRIIFAPHGAMPLVLESAVTVEACKVKSGDIPSASFRNDLLKLTHI